VTDEVTAIYGALGAMMALFSRASTGRGQVVDACLYESAFSLIEPHIPAFDKLGIVANRTGSRPAGFGAQQHLSSPATSAIST
jgi:crotonobetainyl-CoA:carnitine CoA-transferase CaiB-like acyl-CoA transferase